MTCSKCGQPVPEPPRVVRDGPWKPLLTIGPWRCPHYKVIHGKDPNRCDDPWRMWEGHMPDGSIRSCGVAALSARRTRTDPMSEAMATYRKHLERYDRRIARQKQKAAAA
jgi:hypothetical protein